MLAGGVSRIFAVGACPRLVAVIMMGFLVVLAPLLAGCVGTGDGGDGLSGDGDDGSGGDSGGQGKGPGDGDALGSGGTGEGGASQDGSGGDDANSTNGDSSDPDAGGDDASSGNQTDGGDGSGGNGSGGGGGGGGSGGGSGPVSDDPWAGDDPPWPSLSQAQVRPGVRVAIGPEHCTTNFLYRDLVNGSLYLGIAAHCVQDVSLGHKVAVYDVDGDRVMDGYVAYSSWRAISFSPGDSMVGDDVHPHDFALVGLPRDERGIVHPAVMHYGGPTGLAEWDSASMGDLVISYGNSGTRPLDLLNPQRGYIVGTHSQTLQGSQGHYALVHMVSPPLPGDSGSGLMTADGQALGVLSAITVGAPYGAWWEYSSLPHALAHANGYGDWNLSLVTWDSTEGFVP